MAARSSGKRRDGWSCRGLLSGMMLYGCGGGGIEFRSDLN